MMILYAQPYECNFFVLFRIDPMHEWCRTHTSHDLIRGDTINQLFRKLNKSHLHKRFFEFDKGHFKNQLSVLITSLRTRYFG